jgi:hypothetical protein
MMAAMLRDQQTKAESIKAILLGVTAAEKFSDTDQLLKTLDSLMDGIDAMYVPLTDSAKERKSAAREKQDNMDFELLERVGKF